MQRKTVIMDVTSHLFRNCNPCWGQWTEEEGPSESTEKERRNGRSYLEKQLGREVTENEIIPAVF